MANKKSPPPSALNGNVDHILKEIRSLRARSLETVRKMKELEKAVAAAAKSRSK